MTPRWLLKKDLTGELLCQTVEGLVSQPQRLESLGRNAAQLAILDANESIYQEMLALLQRA